MDPNERMRLTRIQQNGPEWFDARCGRVTGSAASKAIKVLQRASGNKKAGDSHGDRDDYMDEIIGEILSGVPATHDVTPWMDRGRELEPAACAYYAFRNHLPDGYMQKTGFWVHPKIDRFGCSPDRLLGTDGVLEAKCPKPKNHIRYLREGVCPVQYYDQVQIEMMCTEREWADFISYEPEQPEESRLFQVRVPRDEKRIAEIEEGVMKFLEDVYLEIQKMGLDKIQVREPDPVSYFDAPSEWDAYPDAVDAIDRTEVMP